MLVRDLMTRDVASVGPGARVPEIARQLLSRGVSAIPVVDEQGRPLGVVSEGDLIGAAPVHAPRVHAPRVAGAAAAGSAAAGSAAGSSGASVGTSGATVTDATSGASGQLEERRQWWLAQLAEGHALDATFLATVQADRRTARDLMTAPAICIADTAAASEAASLMQQHRVKRLPVVSEGRMVGILARADLVRAMAEEQATASDMGEWPLRVAVPARGGVVPARGGVVPARGGVVPALGGGVPASGSGLTAGQAQGARNAASPPQASAARSRSNPARSASASMPSAPSSSADRAATAPVALPPAALAPAAAAPASAASELSASGFRALVSAYQGSIDRRRAEERHRADDLRRQQMLELRGKRLGATEWADLLDRARMAAASGAREFMLIRFPAALCSDGGRAINAPDSSWPRTLVGEPADVYARWHAELQPRGFHLVAQIVDFPDGLPGDAALFLVWRG